MAPASATGEQKAAPKSIDLDGLLSTASDKMTRLDPEPPAEFTFSWRGTAFSARFERHGQGCRLLLDGTLGAVPYSAENQSHRDNLLALLGGPQTGIPGRFWADRQLRLHFATSAEVEERATGTTILGWTTLLLLRTAPWLEHVAALCVARPQSGSTLIGTALDSFRSRQRTQGSAPARARRRAGGPRGSPLARP